MKKLLLLALSVAAIVSCNRQVEVNDPQTGPGDLEMGQLIQLSSGGGVAVTMAVPSGNQGMRTQFLVGDQIGVFAAYGKADASNNVADWGVKDSIGQTGQYFTNWAAQCNALRSTEEGAADTTEKFAWGLVGQGGVGVDRIYPRGQRGIFVYAYYPYIATPETPSADDTVTVDPAKGPLVKVKLLNLNTITTGDDGKEVVVGITDKVPHLQADILFAKGTSEAGEDSVKRSAPLAPLYFQHALAQVTFKVGRELNSAACKFREIVFIVPHSGVMSVIDGKIEISSSTQKADSITYTITDKQNDGIDAGKSAALQLLVANPLMVLPMTDAQAKTCRLQLTVYYGEGEPSTDVANYRKFDANLNVATMKGFAQGKRNTLTMMVSETGMTLEASIAAWDAAGEESDIPIE